MNKKNSSSSVMFTVGRLVRIQKIVSVEAFSMSDFNNALNYFVLYNTPCPGKRAYGLLRITVTNLSIFS